MDVPAVLKDNWDDLKDAGDYHFLANQDGVPDSAIVFMCPCGCGTECSVRIKVGPNKTGHWWGWNGDHDKPILTPSIQRIGGCGWHGYLTDGVFKTC